MTGLHRTDLTTSQKIQCAAQALEQGEHGSKTRLSRAYEISRRRCTQRGRQGGTDLLRVDWSKVERSMCGLMTPAMPSVGGAAGDGAQFDSSH